MNKTNKNPSNSTIEHLFSFTYVTKEELTTSNARVITQLLIKVINAELTVSYDIEETTFLK